MSMRPDFLDARASTATTRARARARKGTVPFADRARARRGVVRGRDAGADNIGCLGFRLGFREDAAS